jgi:hypothetical protein
MKNKLLLSSALISGLMVGGSAIAQTSITGDLAIAYKAQSYELTGGLASKRGFGRESQVNVANKGKLLNGMNYAAGFSLEFDGNTRTSTNGAQTLTQTEAASISNENLFIDVELTPGTTVTVGVDHIQNITRVVPQVLDILDHVASGLGSNAVNGVGANPKENFGIGIVQVIPGSGLTASYNYTPNGGDYGMTDQTADGTTNGRNSAYEYGIVGTDALGVKGLGLAYFKNKEGKDGTTSTTPELEGSMYQVSYSAQGVTGGYSIHKQNRTSPSTVVDQELKMQTVALTYAATKDITLGLTQLKTTSELTGAVDEKIKALQVGYNLGPVSLIVSASKGENIANTTSNDADELGVRLSTKF